MTDAVHAVVPSDGAPVLRVRGATKTCGAVVALEGVDLETAVARYAEACPRCTSAPCDCPFP